MMKMSSKTLNQILSDAGIETIRPVDKKKQIKLKFNNVEIPRPNPEKVYSEVFREFGIDLKKYE